MYFIVPNRSLVRVVRRNRMRVSQEMDAESSVRELKGARERRRTRRKQGSAGDGSGHTDEISPLLLAVAVVVSRCKFRCVPPDL